MEIETVHLWRTGFEILSCADIGESFDGWQGVFDASPETARHLIELGRSDANKALREAELTK